MKKIYFLLLCCLGIVSTGMAQVILATQMGYGHSFASYQYADGAIFKTTGDRNLTLGLAIDKEVKTHLAIHAELGIHSNQTTLNLRHNYIYLSGVHHYRQLYLALAPRYFLTNGVARLFANAGCELLLETENQLNEPGSIFNPGNTIRIGRNDSNLKVGLFIGSGVDFQLGRVQVIVEIRYATQRASNSLVTGIDSAEKLKLQRLGLNFGVGYSFH